MRPGEDRMLRTLTRAMERVRDLQRSLLEAQDEPTRERLRLQLRDMLDGLAAEMESERR
jgi:hypothetical protein